MKTYPMLARKMYSRVEAEDHVFLTLSLDGGELLVHAPVALFLRKEPQVSPAEEYEWAPEPVWTVAKKKLPCLCRVSTAGRQVRSLVTTLTKLRRAYVKYENRLKSSWTGGNAPLLCRGRR
jgi:hypothetical protein